MKRQDAYIVLIYYLIVLIIYMEIYEISLYSTPSQSKRPIIFIAGLGQSPLYYKSQSRWRKIWANVDLLYPKQFKRVQLWKKKMQVHYNSMTDEFDSQDITAWRDPNYIENQFVLTNDVGGISGCCDMTFLSKYTQHDIIKSTAGFRLFTDNLISSGYQVGQTLFGMSYDFRRISGHSYWREFKKRLKDLILYAKNQTQQKVIIITHSLGGILFNAFCHDEPMSTSICQFVGINTPIGGTLRTIHASLCGSSFGMNPFGSRKQERWFQDLESEFSGISLCFPNSKAFHSDYPLIQIEKDKYNLNDLARLLQLYCPPVADIYRNNTKPFLDKCTLDAFGTIPTFFIATQSLSDTFNSEFKIYGEPLFIHYILDSYNNTYALPNSFASKYKLHQVANEGRNWKRACCNPSFMESIIPHIGDGTVPLISLCAFDKIHICASPKMDHSTCLMHQELYDFISLKTNIF